MEFMLRTAVFHVSDLPTLEHILRPSSPDRLAPYARHMWKLCISMRMPLLVYAAIEEPALSATPEGEQARSIANAWEAVIASLGDLSEPRTLDIWIDHDSCLPWSIVNERKILEGLPSENPRPAVNVYMPELLPYLSNPARHFTGESAFTLHRRIRQQYIGLRQPDGSYAMGETQDETQVMELPGLTEKQKVEWRNTSLVCAADRSMQAYAKVIRTHFRVDMKSFSAFTYQQ